MCKLLAALAGFIFGLGLVWLNLYVGQYFTWHPVKNMGAFVSTHRNRRCVDIENCADAPWWLYAAIAVMIFAPSIFFAIFNFSTWKKYNLKKTLQCNLTAIVFISMAYAAFLTVR